MARTARVSSISIGGVEAGEDRKGRPIKQALKRKYKDRVEYEIISPEARVLMTSHHRTKSVGDMIAEFDLETWDAYDRRARRTRQRGLAGTRTPK